MCVGKKHVLYHLKLSGDASSVKRTASDELEAKHVRDSDYEIRLDEDKAEHISEIRGDPAVGSMSCTYYSLCDHPCHDADIDEVSTFAKASVGAHRLCSWIDHWLLDVSGCGTALGPSTWP